MRLKQAVAYVVAYLKKLPSFNLKNALIHNLPGILLCLEVEPNFFLGAGAKKSKTTAQAPQPMENFDCDSTIFSEDFGPNGSSDATGGYRETPFRAVNNIAQRVANMQNMQSTPGRVHQRLGAPQGMSEPEQEAKRMPLYSRYGSGPQPPMQMQQPGRDASSFCSVEELKMLLDENARLRMENEQLRAKLANIPVKSRLGVAPNQENVENAGTPEKALPVDRYAEFVKEQPSVTPRQTALEELSSLKAANKEELSFSFKRCETQLSSDNFSLCHIKIKSYPCALNFYGKGESKHDAQIASATLAVDFVKRLIDGEKLIPYHCSPITLLFMLMTTQNKIEKPSECMTCEKDESSGSQRATVKIEDYEGVEHGNSKKEAKEAVALKCLKDQYGYVPAN